MLSWENWEAGASLLALGSASVGTSARTPSGFFRSQEVCWFVSLFCTFKSFDYKKNYSDSYFFKVFLKHSFFLINLLSQVKLSWQMEGALPTAYISHLDRKWTQDACAFVKTRRQQFMIAQMVDFHGSCISLCTSALCVCIWSNECVGSPYLWAGHVLHVLCFR